MAEQIPNILLVEDSPGWEALIVNALRNCLIDKYRITRAESFDEALTQIGGSNFDLAILDYHLAPTSSGKQQTGLDLARILHERQLCSRVILITAIPTASIEPICSAEGIVLISKARGDLEEEIQREVGYALDRDN